jgi:hypothetical protein
LDRMVGAAMTMLPCVLQVSIWLLLPGCIHCDNF